MLRALEEPIRQIAENAGVEGSIVVVKVKAEKGAFGFNAATETYEDLIKAGVIDPCQGYQTGPAECGLCCRIDADHSCMIAEKPKEKDMAPPMPGGGMPGGGMY